MWYILNGYSFFVATPIRTWSLFLTPWIWLAVWLALQQKGCCVTSKPSPEDTLRLLLLSSRKSIGNLQQLSEESLGSSGSAGLRRPPALYPTLYPAGAKPQMTGATWVTTGENKRTVRLSPSQITDSQSYGERKLLFKLLTCGEFII